MLSVNGEVGAAENPVTHQPIISLRDVCKTYVSGDVITEVLCGIDLDIYAGEFVAIMGASGSGKSTLMHVLGCLDTPTSGTYCFSSNDFQAANVAGLDRDQLALLRRDTFGFVFQSYHLIKTASARENVEVPGIYAGIAATDRHARADELLSRLGLGDRLHHKPNQLSGGQQQRVSIARALMNGGQIILADEPTGALDSKSGAEVMALLKELSAQGHTIVLITHDANVAAHANRIIEIRDGEIVSDDGASPADHSVVRKISAERSAHDGALTTIESVQMAKRALQANWFRTLLTLLGIVIGVASVVVMLAVGEGAKTSVLDRINSMGSNLLMIRPDGRGRLGANGVVSLVPADAKALALLPNVVAAIPEMEGNVTARYGNLDVSTKVTATTWQYSEARNWPVVWGTFFSENDEHSYATVAVLGKTVADSLFPEEDPVGHYVQLNNVPFQVIGILDQKGATGWGGDADDVIFVPLDTGALRLFGQTYVRNITVAVSDVSAMDDTQLLMEQLMQERHGGEDFRIRNMADIVDAVSETQNTLTMLLGSIAAISLLVGGIGVMNIMLVTVTERIHEIGIRIATGASTRNILQQFLTEAVMVSALGGALGVVLGVLLGLIGVALGMPVEFSAGTMLLAFSCAAGTGLLFGFAPALKAARMNPVVALSGD